MGYRKKNISKSMERIHRGYWIIPYVSNKDCEKDVVMEKYINHRITTIKIKLMKKMKKPGKKKMINLLNKFLKK